MTNMTTVFMFICTGSFAVVTQGIASIGATIAGFVLGNPVGILLAVGGSILTIRRIVRVLLSMRRSRKVSG